MNVDGSNARTLEGSGGATTNFDDGPAWSPDSKLVAFSSTAGLGAGRYSEIWVMNADGSDAHAITNLGGWNSWPTWSPNGQRLAFQSTSGAADFASCNPKNTCPSRVLAVDSTGLGKASAFPALPGGATALSPVWLNDRTVVFGSASSAPTYDLWVSDGTTLRQITTNGGSTDAAVAPS